MSTGEVQFLILAREKTIYSFIFYEKNLHYRKIYNYLAAEASKVEMGLSPVVIMKEIFQYTENSVYGLRSDSHIWRTNIILYCTFRQ